MPHLFERLDAAYGRLLAAFGALVAVTIGLIAVGIPLNLVLIKMQWGSIWWMYEAVEYALYMGVFLAAPWVLRQGAHVRVDVVTGALPRPVAVRLEQALDVAGALLCALLCVYGLRAVLSEYEDGTLPDKDLRIANWIVLCFFALGFAMLAVEFLLRLGRAREVIAREGGPADSGF